MQYIVSAYINETADVHVQSNQLNLSDVNLKHEYYS